MARRRKALRGIGRVRRIMKRLPDAVRGQMVDGLDRGGKALAGQMRARAPRGATGQLKAGITYKVFAKTLRMRAGLLVRTWRGKVTGHTFREQDGPFYGRIQDLGRTGQTVNVIRHIKQRKLKGNNQNGNVRRAVFGTADARLRRRGPNKGTPIGGPYKMRVKTLAAKRFVSGAFPQARAMLKRMLDGVWTKAVGQIAGGGDE